MEIISNIIQTTLESFDFAYCIIVNILTYIIIKSISDSGKHLTLWSKRKVLVIVILFTGLLYYFYGTEPRVLLNSAIVTPVFWSWILKPICHKFKIDYKQISLFD